jgi:penicillin-binding protein 1A
MSVAHTDMNIPTIPGLEPHPVQIAEQQRIAEMRSANPGSPGTPGMPGSDNKSGLMPQQTRDALKRVSEAMRRAGEGEPPSDGNQPPPGDAPKDKPAPANKRAGLDPASPTRNADLSKPGGATARHAVP